MNRRKVEASIRVLIALFGCAALLLGGVVLQERTGFAPVEGRILWAEEPASSKEVSSFPAEGISAQERDRLSGEESAASSDAPAAPYSGAVDLNTATAEELQSLNGIGEVLAQRIIDYRNANGGFRSVEEIMNVKGIAEKKFAAIRDRITVKEPAKEGPSG